VVRRVPGSLHPAVATHHRDGDSHRLEEHHHISGGDRFRPGRHQRRPAVLSQPSPGRREQVRDPDRHHARLQVQADVLSSIRKQARLWRQGW